MTTIAQVCRSIVEANIDSDYIKECGFTTLREVYNAEYGYHGLPTWRKCKDYLQGLPSVCTIPFWNDDIINILSSSGVNMDQDEEALIEAYWNECGAAFNTIVHGK